MGTIANKPEAKTNKSTIVTVGIIVGAIGVALSFIPIINNAAAILGLAAAVLGIIGLVKKVGGKAVIALLLGILSIGITLSLQQSWSDSFDKATEEFNQSMDDMSGNNTDDILKNDLDVNRGELSVTYDEYNYAHTVMPVTVTNKRDEATSYDVKIEAVDADGNRIDDETLYVSQLGSGQSQELKAFEYIESDKLDAMQNATFKIVSVSAY